MIRKISKATLIIVCISGIFFSIFVLKDGLRAIKILQEKNDHANCKFEARDFDARIAYYSLMNDPVFNRKNADINNKMLRIRLFLILLPNSYKQDIVEKSACPYEWRPSR